MNKKTKLSSALVTTAIIGGVSVASIAQACGDEPVSAVNRVVNALVSISENTTIPADDQGAQSLFTQFVNAFVDVDSSISNITSINITDVLTNVTANQQNNTVSIAAGAISVVTIGGAFVNYNNDGNPVILSNIELEADSISSVDISTNAFAPVPTDIEILREAMVGLIELGANVTPTDRNQIILNTQITNTLEVLFPENNIMSVTNYSIADNPTNIRSLIQVTELANGRLSLTIDQGLLTIDVQALEIGSFINTTGDFSIGNVVIANGEIQPTLSITSSLVPIYDSTLQITGAIRQLNGSISDPSALSANSLIFYNAFLDALMTSNPILLPTAITEINIINPSTSITSSSDSSAMIAANSITFTTTGGLVTSYSNVNQAISITGIMFDSNTGVISGAEINNGDDIVAQPTNSETGVNTLLSLNGFTGTGNPPADNASGLQFYNALLSAVMAADGPATPITHITGITIVNTPFSVFSNPGGTSTGVTTNSIFITTDQGNTATTFSNELEEMIILGLTIANNEVTGYSSITGITAMPTLTQSNANFGRALNGFSPSGTTNTSTIILYQAIETTLETLVPGNNVSTISISIVSPFTNVTATDSSITFAQGSVSITTDGQYVESFNNSEANLIISIDGLDSNNLITAASVLSGLSMNETVSEHTFNSIRALNGVMARPTGNASAAVIYDAILAAVNNTGSATTYTSLSSVVINEPFATTIVVGSLGAAAAITIGSLFVTATDGTTIDSYNNDTTEVVIPNIAYNAEGNTITSVGTVTGLTAFNEENSLNEAITELTSSTTIPSAASSPNALALWNAILSGIQRTNANVASIIELTISSPATNVTPDFTTDSITFATGSISATFSYDSNANSAEPVNFTNTEALVLTFSFEQASLVIDSNVGEISPVFANNAERIEYAFNQFQFANIVQDYSNFGGNASSLGALFVDWLTAGEAIVVPGETNPSSTFQIRVTGTSTYTNTSLSLSALTITYEILGVMYLATSTSPLTVSGLFLDNNLITGSVFDFSGGAFTITTIQ